MTALDLDVRGPYRLLRPIHTTPSRVASWLWRRPHLVYPVVLLAVLVVITDFSSHMATGDSVTTSRVALAGDIFADRGLVEQRFKPAFYSPAWSSQYLEHYTHFPSLPYYYGWVVASIGVAEWQLIVTGYLIVAAVTLGLWIASAARLLGHGFGHLVALLALTIPATYALLPYNAKSWGDLFFAAAVFLLIVTARSRRSGDSSRSIGWLRGSALFVAGAGVTLSTYEYLPALVVVTLGFSFLDQRGGSNRSLLSGVAVRAGKVLRDGRCWLLGSGALAALVFHFATNTWALGSIDAAIQDLIRASEFRSSGAADFNEEFAGVLPFLGWWLSGVGTGMGLELSSSVALLAGLVGAVVLTTRSGYRDVLYRVALIWIGVLAFGLVFRQWTWVHFELIGLRHFIFPITLLLAGALYAMRDILELIRRAEWKATRTWSAGLVAVLLVAGVVLPTVANARHTSEFLGRHEELSYDTELDQLRSVMDVTEDLGPVTRIVTDDNNLMRTWFLHQPPEYFSLAPVTLETFPRPSFEDVLLRHELPEQCSEQDTCAVVVTEVLASEPYAVEFCEQAECRTVGRWTIWLAEEIPAWIKKP